MQPLRSTTPIGHPDPRARAIIAAGLALVTCPAVALTQLLISGSVPPLLTLLAIAAGAALIGLCSTRATSGPIDRGSDLTGGWVAGQLAGAQLLGHLAVYLSLGEPSNSCLPAMGRGAALGLRLAILSPGSSCAPGQYVAGPVTAAAAAAVLLLAGTLLISQLLIAAGGGLLLRAAQAAWLSAGALLAAVTLVIGAFVPLVITRVTRRRPASDPDLLSEPIVIGAPLRRGPPAFIAA